MLLQIFYFIPAILGTLFIAVGLYHGSKFYSLTKETATNIAATIRNNFFIIVQIYMLAPLKIVSYNLVGICTPIVCRFIGIDR